MYGVAVTRELDAVHYLFGGDWGKENQPHSHHYKVEVLLSGEKLDRFGYLLDITLIERSMDGLVEYFRGAILNHLPEFTGLNPSIEHFCRIWCHSLLKGLDSTPLKLARVRIWENTIAWATYTEQI
ncbi:MAG: 6-carboxytetrahydropterin synthase [Candidatus Tectomicrobia bacterium]|uniref:6-carboxy-5,6,7,8-tetrahydropterin synthase n=1 Tax=Tectimicrobiota bacterium TaxID=2528274 RepID=A0A932CMJ2_UNCTE|nr:6-carboxytetrahydropterin synthase [Candidatus Tectomicrobia bacterium]